MDPVTDANHSQLPEIFATFDPPDFVKDAMVDDWANLPPRAYAFRGMFPTHTKCAAWLSSTYFLKNQSEFQADEQARIRSRLVKAASQWGFDFEDLERKYEASIPKTEMKWAFEREVDGEMVRLFPIPNGESIKKAAEHLKSNRGRLPYRWRREIAGNLLKAAKEHDMQLAEEDYLLKAAGLGISDPAVVCDQFLCRSLLVHDPEASEMLRKHALAYRDSAFDPDVLQKNAELMADIDEHFGLARHYGSTIEAPEDTVFGITLKAAGLQANSGTLLLNGRVIFDEQLDSADLDKIAEAVGGEFETTLRSGKMFVDVEEFKKWAQLLQADDANTVCAMLPESKGMTDLLFLQSWKRTESKEPKS